MPQHIHSHDVVMDPNEVGRLAEAYQSVRGELARVIVGQDRVVEELLIALLCRGHCILEGVPGLAKTLMISTLARTLNLSFSRIQFTPDLMPSDITGTEMIEDDHSTGSRSMRFVPGPVFANVILADEINRTPPKTQSALLEAMQEQQVTAAGRTQPLPLPFFVLATQNPIEQEGTYPLPEAQLDRFMFKVLVGYPDEEEELAIIRRTTSSTRSEISPVLSAEQIIDMQELVRAVPCAEPVIRYAMRLVRLTRGDNGQTPRTVAEYVAWGAGPRASQSLVLAAKARAILQGRCYVSTDDIRQVAHPVLRHRIITNFNADAEGVNADQIVDELLRQMPRVETPGLDAVGAERVLKRAS